MKYKKPLLLLLSIVSISANAAVYTCFAQHPTDKGGDEAVEMTSNMTIEADSLSDAETIARQEAVKYFSDSRATAKCNN